MTDLFSTLVDAAMGTPESMIETATPLLRPRFAAADGLSEAVSEVASGAMAPVATTAASPVVPHPTGFALDMPSASAPQTLLPPLSAEAVQAGPAPITPVLASERPAERPLAPALAPPSAPPATIDTPLLPEKPAIPAVAAAVLGPVAADQPGKSVQEPAPGMAGLAASMPFLPSVAAAAPVRHDPVTASPAPSIAIHIGRIEVASPAPVAAPASQATSAAAPAVARAPSLARAAPRQSLDSYLGQRRR